MTAPESKGMPPKYELKVLHERISEHLDAIKKFYKVPMKVTVLVRNPAKPDGSQDTMVTDDTLPEIIAAMTQLENLPFVR